MKATAFSIGAILSIWIGSWLCTRVWSFGDWQHFPAFMTSAVSFVACVVGALWSLNGQAVQKGESHG